MGARDIIFEHKHSKYELEIKIWKPFVKYVKMWRNEFWISTICQLIEDGKCWAPCLKLIFLRMNQCKNEIVDFKIVLNITSNQIISFLFSVSNQISNQILWILWYDCYEWILTQIWTLKGYDWTLNTYLYNIYSNVGKIWTVSLFLPLTSEVFCGFQKAKFHFQFIIFKEPTLYLGWHLHHISCIVNIIDWTS